MKIVKIRAKVQVILKMYCYEESLHELWLNSLLYQKKKKEKELYNEKLTGGDEKTIAKPRLEESVFGRFVDVHVTGQDYFNVTWINQENN